VRVHRNRLDPFLATFDAPVPFATTGRRDVTTVPAQSLALFNDPFVLNLASRVASSVGDRDEFIRTIWRRLLGRDPNPQEQTRAEQLIESLQNRYGALARRRNVIQARIAERQREVSSLRHRIRSQLLEPRDKQDNQQPADLKPMAHWDFEGNLRDSVGSLHAEMQGGARVEEGRLILDGTGWASTPPLPKPLKAKTLQARVLLNNLDQRGGGVITVQTLDGVKFDSIVFGEQTPQRWLAGSDHYRRTKRFGGPDELEANQRPVVLTIVYQADGTIIGYRNGKPYGKSYRSIPVAFEKDKAQVVFGLRHGTRAIGNRTLRGSLLEATLYDRALTRDEVAVSVAGDSQYISEAEILVAMTPEQRQRVKELNQTIHALESELASLGKPVPVNQAYADFVLAMFNLKEFIYVR